MLDLLLIIGFALSLSILVFQDPYIGFIGISLVLVSNLAFYTPIYKDNFRTRSPTLSFLIFVLAFYPVSKNMPDSFEILSIRVSVLMGAYFLIMLIGWLLNFSIPQQIKRPSSIVETISVLDNGARLAYRILVGLLFIRWTRFIPASSENVEITLGILASLGLIFSLYFDLLADRSDLLKIGDTTFGSFSHVVNVSVFQFAILGFLYWLGRIHLIFWKYYVLSLLVLSIIGIYAKVQGSALNPKIGKILGISSEQLDSLIETSPQKLEKVIIKRGFEVPEGALKDLGIGSKALVVPLGKKISSQALAISLDDPSNISVLPEGILDQIASQLFGRNRIDLKDLPSLSSSSVLLLSDHLPQIKDSLKQISFTLNQYKEKLIERIAKKPFVEIQEMDNYSRVSIPGIVDVVETPQGKIVKTFGLKIAEAGKKNIIDGWLRIVEMEDWEYVNVMGIIRVLEHKTLKYSEVRFPGFRFREGTPPKPFETLEQEILEKLSLFWSNAFLQLIPEFHPQVLSFKDGEIRALPLPSESSVALPSDPFKTFDNLLVANTKEITTFEISKHEDTQVEEKSSAKIEEKRIIRPEYEILEDNNP